MYFFYFPDTNIMKLSHTLNFANVSIYSYSKCTKIYPELNDSWFQVLKTQHLGLHNYPKYTSTGFPFEKKISLVSMLAPKVVYIPFMLCLLSDYTVLLKSLIPLANGCFSHLCWYFISTATVLGFIVQSSSDAPE